MDTKYYAVYRGKTPGIYATWVETRTQTDGYPGAVFCRCNTLAEAEIFMQTGAAPSKEASAMASKEASAMASKEASKRCFDIKRINPDDIMTCRPGFSVEQPSAPDITDAIEAYRSHPAYCEVDEGVLYVYTDGSAYGNGSRHARGGYGIFYSRKDIPPVYAPIKQAKVTNCVAELTAILETLQSLKKYRVKCCYIYSDCEYAMDVISGKKKAHTNLHLVEPAQKLFRDFAGKVTFTHVRSHTGAGDLHSLGNEVADMLAKKGTQQGH